MLSPLALVVVVADVLNSTTIANEPSATSTSMSTSLISKSHYNINYIRQQLPTLDVTTSSSSYDYWWPYPPGGAAPTPTPTSTSTILMTESAELVFSFQPSSTSTSLTTTISSTIQTSDTTLTNTTSTSVSSPTIIQITALPANATTMSPVTQHKLRPHSQFKLVYLAPVFVLLGVVFGSACAWVGYGCVRRGPRDKRRKNGTRELEVGPAYCDLGRDAEGGKEKGSWIGRTLFVDRGLEGEGQGEKGDELFSWPTFGRAAGDGGAGDVPRGDQWRGEDDPFLLGSPVAQSSKSKSGSEVSRAKSSRTTRSKSARTTKSVYSDTDTEIDPLSLISPTQYHSSDEEGERIPWESLRHKSIKRGILEKVGADEEKWRLVVRGVESGDRSGPGGGGRRRISHGRKDSDMYVEDVRLGEPMEMQKPQRAYSRGASGEDGGSNGAFASRVSSTRTTGSTRSMGVKGKDGGTEWVAGSGFRIVEEDVGAGERKGDGVGGKDRYTALPVRNGRGRSASPVKGVSPGSRGGRRPGVLARFDSAVLPQSPPQIMSPPLESQLCFTPTLGALTSRPPASYTPTTPTRKVNGSDGGRGRQGKKLHSAHPPPLPFPSSPSPGANSKSPYRGRLVKSPAGTPQKDLPTLPPSRRTTGSSSSASSSANLRANNTSTNKGRGTPAQRYTARRAALQKVDEIVERSWSTRDLGPGGMRSLSPTGFGARA